MKTHQERIVAWIRSRFGEAVLTNRKERAARIFEEAAELTQAEEVDVDVCQRIVERVYGRPVGEPAQEATGVSLTLLAWASVAGIDLDAENEKELTRVESVPVETSRQKHRNKEHAGTTFESVEEP